MVNGTAGIPFIGAEVINLILYICTSNYKYVKIFIFSIYDDFVIENYSNNPLIVNVDVFYDTSIMSISSLLTVNADVLYFVTLRQYRAVEKLR